MHSRAAELRTGDESRVEGAFRRGRGEEGADVGHHVEAEVVAIQCDGATGLASNRRGNEAEK